VGNNVALWKGFGEYRNLRELIGGGEFGGKKIN
jgi:hypothetical protein